MSGSSAERTDGDQGCKMWKWFFRFKLLFGPTEKIFLSFWVKEEVSFFQSSTFTSCVGSAGGALGQNQQALNGGRFITLWTLNGCHLLSEHGTFGLFFSSMNALCVSSTCSASAATLGSLVTSLASSGFAAACLCTHVRTVSMKPRLCDNLQTVGSKTSELLAKDDRLHHDSLRQPSHSS